MIFYKSSTSGVSSPRYLFGLLKGKEVEELMGIV
jgi:hypothetical protein